jgi:hypothetical protein
VNPENKRSTPRFNIRLSVELQLDGRTTTGTTRNVSVGGICIELERRLTEGSYLAFKLFLVEDDIESDDEKPLDLVGTVQWAAESEKGFAMGIKFGNLTRAQKTTLEARLAATGAS